jgi:hypothetical protein
MYFECNAMNCSESLATPLDKMHIQNRSKMLDCMRSGMFGRNEKLQFGKLVKQDLHSNGLFLQYLLFIEEYSGRALTKEGDSLNAFQGIMQHFSRYTVEQGTARFYHVCGIPYLDAPHKSQIKRESYFVDALAWNHVWNSGDTEALNAGQAFHRGLGPDGLAKSSTVIGSRSPTRRTRFSRATWQMYPYIRTANNLVSLRGHLKQLTPQQLAKASGLVSRLKVKRRYTVSLLKGMLWFQFRLEACEGLDTILSWFYARTPAMRHTLGLHCSSLQSSRAFLRDDGKSCLLSSSLLSCSASGGMYKVWTKG